MCGICGIYNLNNKNAVSGEMLGNMLGAIRHRGPDGSASMALDHVALGFVRLGFLDLEGGMQPIWNEERTVAMVCNGEIFNYQELKQELVEKGHCFSTGTDVEILLHLYEDVGTEFPKRLNGQFAVAIYDGNRRQLFLVRDQIGICPLFYTVTQGRLLFASEIKAILAYPGVERRLDMKAVDQLMNFPGLAAPQTFFAGIRALEPGHMLQIGEKTGIRDTEYWDLSYSVGEDMGEAYYTERLRELLKKSIRRRLIADVPIGFYVSGGLDSSVVACYIGKYLLDSVYSFSAEIGEAELDESRFQKLVRDCVQSRHYSVKVTEEDIWEYLEQVIYHAEAGLRESYDVAAFLLSRLVQDSPAKAVLTGQGSDEFFYGYVGFMVDQFREMQKGQMSAEECACNEKLWGDPFFRYERDHTKIRQIHRKVYSVNMRAELERFSAIEESPVRTERLKGMSAQQRRSYIDYKLRLSEHLLGEHGDRMFFAHSVEGRHPFLDMELLNFVTTIPDRYKLNGVNEKYILKKASEGIVPDEIIRRKKFPFQAPGMSAMIKKSVEIPYLEESLLKKYDVFDTGYVNHLKQVYMQDGFKLMGAYEIDYLLIVMTVTMLCEKFSLSV